MLQKEANYGFPGDNMTNYVQTVPFTLASLIDALQKYYEANGDMEIVMEGDKPIGFVEFPLNESKLTLREKWPDRGWRMPRSSPRNNPQTDSETSNAP